MKVLFAALGIYSHIGGIEAFNQRVVRCLGHAAASRGWPIVIQGLWDELVHAALAPDEVTFAPASGSKICMVSEFRKQVQRQRPDLILYGHVLLAPLAVMARIYVPRARQVLFTHGTEVWGDRRFRSVPRWERVLVRKLIDRVVCVSRFTMDQMSRTYGLPESRFRLLPNAVDCNGLPSETPTRDLSRAPLLLTVARLGIKDTYKGVDKVILAMPHILRAVPSAQYWVVGAGPLRERLEDLARLIGVEQHVHFFGYLSAEKLREVYEKARVFIMPSTGEGFGIVFLEAWKHELAVICGNADASREVVTHGVNGLTVDPSSVIEIAESALRLLKDEAFCAALARRGHETVVSRYRHEVFQARLLSILEEETKRQTQRADGHSQAS